jgi:RNA polymerase sigma-70 factor, ECF subfamily
LCDLVEKARDGDLDAFGVLVERYKDMSYGASYAILGNFHDAQDVTQDAFVQAWQKLSDLKNTGAFPGWLYRITRNLSLDRVRRSREKAAPIDDVAATLPDSGHKGPAQCAEQNELHETVLAAIRSLSEPNRLATALFYIDGYSIEEVAGFLEVPSGTVKRRLHDSRTQLREKMVDMVEETLKSNPLPEEFARGTLQKIGDFVCLDILGTGGMGSVFLCEHPVLKHKVAIKILANARPGWQEALRTHHEIFNRLHHPSFAKSFSYGEHQGRPYIVAEYLQGVCLQEWHSKHATHRLREILRLMAQVADAVCHAHDMEVVIGCIRPETIIVAPNGTPVLVDVGSRQPGKQKDIWRTGFVMYQLLVGELLVADAFEKEMQRVLEAPGPVDLAPLSDQAPDYIVAVVKKCLQKAPQDGFPTAAALRYALEEAQFADLVRLKNYNIQRLLLDVEAGTLAVALAGAAEAITAHIFANAGDEVANRIRQEMTDNPPTPDAAHAARLAIVATATRLLEEQRIDF